MSSIEAVRAQLEPLAVRINGALQDVGAVGRDMTPIQSEVRTVLAGSQRPEAELVVAHLLAAQNLLGEAVRQLSAAHAGALHMLVT